MCDDVFVKVFNYMASLVTILTVYFVALYFLNEFVKNCKNEALAIATSIGTFVILVVGFIITVSNL